MTSCVYLYMVSFISHELSQIYVFCNDSGEIYSYVWIYVLVPFSDVFLHHQFNQVIDMGSLQLSTNIFI